MRLPERTAQSRSQSPTPYYELMLPSARSRGPQGRRAHDGAGGWRAQKHFGNSREAWQRCAGPCHCANRRCVRCAAPCMLLVASRMLQVACSMLQVACCKSHVASGKVACCKSHVTCCKLHVASRTSHVAKSHVAKSHVAKSHVASRTNRPVPTAALCRGAPRSTARPARASGAAARALQWHASAAVGRTLWRGSARARESQRGRQRQVWVHFSGRALSGGSRGRTMRRERGVKHVHFRCGLALRAAPAPRMLHGVRRSFARWAESAGSQRADLTFR